MTRLGIIVLTGLNNSVNLGKSKGLALKWLRGLAANAALAPRMKQVSMPSHIHTNAKDKAHSHRVHTHYVVVSRFLIKTYERLLKTHGRIPLVVCQA